MPHTHGTVNEVTRGSKAHQRRLMMTLTLTGTVFVAEIVGAIITGSLALLVDAGHMLTDMSVLIASTVTAVLMRRKPNSSRTWGWARLEVLTAEAGAMILLFVGLYALIEAGMRLFGESAEHVADSGLLLFFGILGLAANVGSIIILAGQHNDNMNMKAAFLEVVNDALGSVAVIASAVVMMLTGWDGFDAIAGGLIALLMIPRAVKLLRNALKVLLEETPDGLNLDEVRTHLENIPHVVAVHDLHAHAHGACRGGIRHEHGSGGECAQPTAGLSARAFPRLDSPHHVPARTAGVPFAQRRTAALLNGTPHCAA